MKQKYYLVFLFWFSLLTANAQIGGESTYQFLELTNSARIAALGGSQIAIYDTTDLNLPYYNPAALHKGMENKVLVNYVNYLSDINYGYASYSKSYDSIGNFAVGMHYINYGDFRESTEFGELTGNHFKAAEYALNLIYSNHYKRLNYGVNLKPILSSFESYQSVGFAADLGLSFASKSKYTNVALVARNIGGSVNLQHLNNWDLANPEPKKEKEGDLSFLERDESFGKQLMRHIVFGVELLPSENFILRAGYNYQRRQELKFDDRASTVGFSAGFGIKVKRFRLDYGIARYHLAGSSNLFSLSINLNNSF